MCIWQSQAFAGALSVGGAVPDEFGTVIWACVSRDWRSKAAPNAPPPALSRKVRRVSPSSLVTSSTVHAGSRSRGDGKRSDLGPGLGIRERTELRGCSARNRGAFVARLEAREVGAVAPGQRTAQPHARLDRCVVHDV